jgi:hypothetical protein
MHSPSVAAPGSPYRATSGGGQAYGRGPFSWPRRAEAWLDSKGRGAWIAAMVLGFIFAWPIGLFLALYITWTQRWSNDMFGHSCRSRRHMTHEGHHRGWGRSWQGYSAAFRPSGNTTFDNYKAETLHRLEEEQEAFESFLQRLREAKDKKEFDAFMEDRAAQTARSAETGETPPAPPAPEAPRKGEY